MSKRCLAEPTRAIQCAVRVTAEVAVSLASLASPLAKASACSLPASWAVSTAWIREF